MNVLGIIFANDSELGSLTELRTTASVPFAGRYRQVDFQLTNMAAAGIRHIGIISRHNYQSLMHHIGGAEEWGLELGEGGLEFLTPFSSSLTDNYRGKLETLNYSMNFLKYGPEDEYVVMSGSSILCNMDIQKLLASHISSGKDVTVLTKAGIADGTRALDLAVKLDKKGEIADLAVNFVAPAEYLASMDVFVLSKKFLVQRVQELVARNMFHMDRDFILGQWQQGELSLNVYQFDGTALYNESIADYYKNSLALIDSDVRHDLFGRHHSIYTKVRDRVPVYYGENANVTNSIVADGCVLEGDVKNSVLFRQVTIGEGSTVENCVIMNDAQIGEGCQLSNVILDKDVIVPAGQKLCGTPSNPTIIKKGAAV